jgi:hypothetical protein
MKRPNCERKGTSPHPATKTLVFDLPSGRQTRFSCDEHANDRFGSLHACYVSELLGYDDPTIPTYKSCARTPAEPRSQTPATSSTPRTSLCIRCCERQALPYPAGFGGQLCQASRYRRGTRMISCTFSGSTSIL